MGFLKKLFTETINIGVQQRLISAANSKQNNEQKCETLENRVSKEKQELADKIRTQAKFQSQQLLKIVNDCAELVNTTVNPDVFFNRYNLILEHLETLSGLECTGIFENSPELPSEAFLRVEANFVDATNIFLDRSFENAKNHANTLKTDNGKINAISRYFDNMEKYIVYMSAESVEHFEKMKETYLKGI